MKHSHASHGAHAGHAMMKTHDAKKLTSHIAKGAAMSAGAQTGKKLMSNVKKHPLLLIGLGAVGGFFIHKYRKEIISSVSSVTSKGKDFVLQQKENLEDIVAETRESKD